MSDKKETSDAPRKPKVVKWTVLTIIAVVLVIACGIGIYVAFGSAQAINIYLDVDEYEVENYNEDAVYYESAYDSVEEIEDNGESIARQLSAEGIVLLVNEDDALPLDTSETITTFGTGSVNYALCGTGSADIDTSDAPTLKEALESVGFTVNETQWDWLEEMAGDEGEYGQDINTTDMTGQNENYNVNEIPTSEYTDEVQSSWEEYGDVALVTITRLSGELYDLTNEDYVDGYDVLDLSEEELAMFDMIEEAGFDKVIVIINSCNALNCEFLNEYDIDAVLWVGYPGTYGLYSMAEILCGEVNPSGALVDTYAYDNGTAPAMADFYTQMWANHDDYDDDTWYDITSSLDGNEYYTVYQEGIYVGYRYYETRYEDVVMGTENVGDYDYSSEVAFTFGYGLSYTDFEWSDFSVEYDSSTDSFIVNVTVTNTGSYAGKDIVQIYFQSPYTEYDKENLIEKASVELCGYAKTSELEPGESETVTIEFDREEFETYDSEGYETYILDAGTYYIAAGENAHDALNNILAAKGYTTADGMDYDGDTSFVATYEQDELDATTYSVSSTTGYEITNQFSSADLSEYGIDFTYLSRSDWVGTWPTDDLELEVTDEMLEEINLYLTYDSETYDGVYADAEMPTTGADNGLTLAMMIGLDYDDEQWDELLDQLTIEEMATLIGEGYHNTTMIVSVSKPATIDDNGPQGFTQSLTGVDECYTAYTDENTMAATWNVDLMYSMGEALGEDVLSLGGNGLYGPAMNIHRTAYAGRNFEYYSEDPYLSGTIAAAEVAGIQSKGIYCYIKHYALNDAETNCRCVSTWATEQAIREIYLEPFRKAVEDGGALAVMNSFARIGTTWTGAHYGLITEVLRNEWGFEGFVITDFSGNSAFAAYGIYLETFDVAYGVLAGTNTWDSSATQWTDDLLEYYADDPIIVTAMREAAHHILYVVANSAAMNGYDANTTIEEVTPWWETALIVLMVVLCVLAVGAVIMLIREINYKKKYKAAS